MSTIVTQRALNMLFAPMTIIILTRFLKVTLTVTVTVTLTMTLTLILTLTLRSKLTLSWMRPNTTL